MQLPVVCVVESDNPVVQSLLVYCPKDNPVLAVLAVHVAFIQMYSIVVQVPLEKVSP